MPEYNQINRSIRLTKNIQEGRQAYTNEISVELVNVYTFTNVNIEIR